MKVKLSIALDPEILAKIDTFVESGIFRTRSHAVDYVLNHMKGGRPNGS